jgi:hypothetical protein
VPNPDVNASERGSDKLTANKESLQGLVYWPDVQTDEVCLEFLELLGMDRLEVWIQSNSGGSEEQERKIRNELADVVLAVGDESLNDLRKFLEERSEQHRQITRNREFGLRVQKVVEMLLRGRGLSVKVIDRGYDRKKLFPQMLTRDAFVTMQILSTR